MTNAPERIALRWKVGAAVTQGPLMDHPDYTRWVREDVAAAVTRREQNLRNELGQLTHAHLRLNNNMQDMRADLLSQREAITRAIWHIDRGELREAREALDEELQRRDRTRPQRKGRAA